MAKNQIQIFSEIEQVQRNITTFIGENDNPRHLVTEVLDNALDEMVNGYADTVRIDIDNKTHIITVFDNGRGLPMHTVKNPETGQEYDSIVAVATKLHSSGKFDRDTYKVSIGQNGIGTTAVNFLSSDFIIDTKHGNTAAKYIFENGKFVSKINSNRTVGTTIIFKPNKKFFTKTLDVDIENFRERLKLTKAEFPDKTIILNEEEIPAISYEELVRQQLNIDQSIPLFELSASKDDSSIRFVFTYDISENASTATKSLGDVNLKNSEGTFLTSVSTAVVNGIFPNIPKNYILDKWDLRSNLRCYCSVIVPHPKYDSQNKVRFLNDIQYLIEPLIVKISNLFKENTYLKQCVEKINENKILKSHKKSSTTKKRKSIENPVKDCNIKPGERLFIVEGDSAAGNLVSARNPDIDAVFPLKGKNINVLTNTFDKILANKEIKYLLETLGIDPSSKTETDINYKNVVLMADADADGGHINCLMELVMWKFIPNIMKEGRVKILLAPLYGVRNSKGVKLHYSTIPPELKQGDTLVRYKGLGEMNANLLGDVIKHGKYLTIKFPENTKLVEDFFKTEIKKQLIDDPENCVANIYNSF